MKSRIDRLYDRYKGWATRWEATAARIDARIADIQQTCRKVDTLAAQFAELKKEIEAMNKPKIIQIYTTEEKDN